MSISTEHRLIFVHVPKTAGQAVGAALRAQTSVGEKRSLWRRLSRRLPIREAPGAAYFRLCTPARDIAAKIGRETFDSFQSFAVVRDPFDHAVSLFEYLKQYRIKSVSRRVSALSFGEYLALRATPPVPVDGLSGRVRGQSYLFLHMPDQSYFLTDTHGAVMVDRVARFENLAEDVNAIARDFGLGPLNLPKVNVSKTRDRAKSLGGYYENGEADLVRRIYASDFTRFGYSEADPA